MSNNEEDLKTSNLTINDVLSYYRSKVVNAYVAAVASSGNSFPVEIANECRNCLTHLARTLEPSLSESECQHELRGAMSHLIRIEMDCSKLITLNSIEKSEEITENLINAGSAAGRSVRVKAAELRTRRLKISEDEANIGVKHLGIDIARQLRELANDYDDYAKYLDDEYSGDTLKIIEAKKNEIEKFASKWNKINISLGFVFGILASYIASMIWQRFPL